MDIAEFADNRGIGGGLSNGRRRVSDIEGGKNED